MKLRHVGLGGGCQWRTEAVFQNLRGVSHVAQGFICSQPPHDSLSEAVLVDFDPAQISLFDLIEIHLRTHASNSQYSMREKYRSAIYVMNSHQEQDAGDILKNLQGDFDNKLVTRVLLFPALRVPMRNTITTMPITSNQFCHRYIDPKLETLRREYAHLSQD